MSKGNLIYQVYFATFDKARYISEIGKLLYPGKQFTYPTLIGENKAINKCKKLGLIIEDKSTKMPENGSVTPYHFEKRDYYKANPTFLVEEINNRLDEDNKLSPEEEKVIGYVFNHESFKMVLNSLLFGTDKDGNQIFLKENADLEIIIQFIAYLCTHSSILMKTMGLKNQLISFQHFKNRFDNIWLGRIKEDHHGTRMDRKLRNIKSRYVQEISEKYVSNLFSKDVVGAVSILKRLPKEQSDVFFVCFNTIGTILLEKIAHLSLFEPLIKAMYVEISAIIVPSTFNYFNIIYPDDEERKKNPPQFLKPIIPTLKNMKSEIENITRKQRH